MSDPPRSLTVLTHAYPEQTGAALRRVIEVCADAGVRLRLAPEEVAKHGLGGDDRVGVEPGPGEDTELALVLGGDGTILAGLRQYAGRGVPVFGINYGAVGFLSTVDGRDLEAGLAQALAGDYETLLMPALVVQPHDGGERRLGINDISFHRRVDERVAVIDYSIGDEQLANVRCDGVVAATPVGSTGYNLANGGPVLAWGVEGFVVSFIAPHTLTARALVVAPDDVLRVINRSEREGVEMTTDGQLVETIGPGEGVDVEFTPRQVLLAQRPGTTFYRRFLDKFGPLAK